MPHPGGERESGDAGLGDEAQGDGEAVFLGGAIDVTDQGAALSAAARVPSGR